MLERPRIINVERKPNKCPVCGERVVDIIYGTGDMTEVDFMLEYRKEGIMGGDNTPSSTYLGLCICPTLSKKIVRLGQMFYRIRQMSRFSQIGITHSLSYTYAREDYLLSDRLNLLVVYCIMF